MLDFTVFAPFSGDIFKDDKIDWTEYRKRGKEHNLKRRAPFRDLVVGDEVLLK
jgi:hypothetical protein